MKKESLDPTMLLTNAAASLVLAAASIFGDNMVLQRDLPVPVWGTATPGEEIVVTVAGHEARTVADAAGQWTARLAPLAAGGPHVLDIKAVSSAVQFTNVLVGEVWIASGQSNMRVTLANANDSANEIAAANFPALRLFTVPPKNSRSPLTRIGGNWTACSPDSAATFSAVAYFFGRRIHRELGVPVGLIHASSGGTPAEGWTPLPALKTHPDLAPLLAYWEQAIAEYPEARRKYDEELPRLQKALEPVAAKAKAEGRRPPEVRRPPAPDSPYVPGNIYNGMIHPLVPFAFRGVIWYQGESNAQRAEQYRALFPALIRAWREAWGQGDFPFYFVQLANAGNAKPEPEENAWAELREAQAMALTLPNTAMATAIDIGDAKDIHPKNKQEVGRRLALIALARLYGKKDLADSGPTHKSMTREGDTLRITFDNLGGGLATRDGRAPKGFAIAGEDRKFVWADAKIEGDTVVLRSAVVPKPVAARYAWAINPDTANLVNKAGLPAYPFRTDTWPGITTGKLIPTPDERGG